MEEKVADVYDNKQTGVHTNDTVTTPMYITTDALYMYGCRVITPDGIG